MDYPELNEEVVRILLEAVIDGLLKGSDELVAAGNEKASMSETISALFSAAKLICQTAGMSEENICRTFQLACDLIEADMLKASGKLN